MIKSITLVHCVNQELANTQMFGIHYMPVWAYTLASYIRKELDCDIKLYDNRMASKDSIESSDIFLFSGINQDEKDLIALNLYIKNKFPHTKTVLGGPITWSFNLDGSIGRLDSFDYIFIGDGENAIVDFLKTIMVNPNQRIFENNKKFNLSESLEMDKLLLSSSIKNYYGGIIEIARGCPFLCEFCDIRIQIDNNKTHVKKIETIINEIDYFSKLDISQILFACDNFIGDLKWAEKLCDAIINWSEETGKSINIYTWLTINLGNNDRLLNKMKKAGFDMLFIGIESFGTNQLLETAKIQNVKTTMVDSIKNIQAYGFIVVAGLIFGFDSDPDNVAEETLEGILQSGLITGDPSLLMALPGTPLYKRMSASNRLRDGKLGLGGSKFCTNILYLKPKETIIRDLEFFVKNFNDGNYQYKRLRQFYKNLDVKKCYKPKSKNGTSYINIFKFIKLIFKKPKSLFDLFLRFFILLRPDRLFYILKAGVLTIKLSRYYDVMPYYKLWGFMWSNSLLKYNGIKHSDFDIDSVSNDFNLNDLIPNSYLEDLSEPIPEAKIRAQRKLTVRALTKIIESSET